jgi:hypothetical protein
MRTKRVMALFGLWAVVSAPAGGQTPGTTAFTYQGRLADGSVPADGLYDFQFRLFSVPVGSKTIAKTNLQDDVPVTRGLFVVELDFGAPVFDGSDRWLEIGVRPGASAPGDPYTTLTPRQPLTPVPYALFAPNAGTISGGLAGEITGDVSSTVVSNAVSANTADAIVRRDGGGGFSAGSLSLSGNLNLLDTTSNAVGVITKAGSPFLHNFGTNNTFLGALAGNTTLSGSSNVGVGTQALGSLGSGSGNVAVGAQAGTGLLNGSNNIYIGAVAGSSSESEKIRIGANQASAKLGTFKLESYFVGSESMFLGNPAGPPTSTGGLWNTGVGSSALIALGSSSNENSAFGARALNDVSSGDSNSAFGSWALRNLGSGSGNVAVGAQAGTGLLSGSNNIYIGAVAGSSSESNTIRLGSSSHTATFLPGLVTMSGAASVGGNLSVATTGALSFGAATRQMINLWNANYGIGVQSATTYQRSDGGFAWFQGGVHADDTFDPGGGTTLMTLNEAELRVNGAFVSSSDRSLKQDVKPVDVESILERVDRLPINEWSYKAAPETRHVGPMAQDFRAAFGLGSDDRHIATVDADGIALAAIQALNRRLEAELRSLRAELEALRNSVNSQR